MLKPIEKEKEKEKEKGVSKLLLQESWDQGKPLQEIAQN